VSASHAVWLVRLEPHGGKLEVALCSLAMYLSFQDRSISLHLSPIKNQGRRRVRHLFVSCVQDHESEREPSQQSRGAQGVCCRRCLQIATKSSTNHQQARCFVSAPSRFRSCSIAPAAATTTSTTRSFFSCCCFLSFFDARASPLRVFACVRNSTTSPSPSSVASFLVVAGGVCPTHAASCSFSQSPKLLFMVILIR